jgi:hypothetical protein
VDLILVPVWGCFIEAPSAVLGMCSGNWDFNCRRLWNAMLFAKPAFVTGTETGKPNPGEQCGFIRPSKDALYDTRTKCQTL